MIVLIGLFWDVNEIWLVLVVGILLIVFFMVYSLIFIEFYLLIVLMLIVFIMCGVVFDFWVKVKVDYKDYWDLCFKIGFLLVVFI